MLPIFLFLAGADDAILSRYHTLTAAEERCVVDPASTDITVCGMRSADRYRITFIVPEAGDPKIENVPVERDRLLYRRTPLQELSPFLVGGGMVGVHVSTRTGIGTGEARTLAP